LTKDKCEKLHIDDKYSFDNLMVLIKDEEQLFELFYNDNEFNSVIGQIYEKTMFSTGFKLQSKSNLKNILTKLKDINIDNISLSCDIVGFIYELHLKTGTSQAMRDLGQYFTNRQVIDYMVKLCKPIMNKNGTIETILDPTMGTGGFLTIASKYLNDKYKIDWNINKKNIIGFDIDDNVRSMALLNMFLENGYIFDTTLVKRDTLHNDFMFEDKTYIDKVDVILANEPFGVKGIVYKDCCERIKNLKINGTKAEPLFLQLMMTTLNKNGRCAVIVPDGVLFNDANLHTNTRKYLLEHFNLQKVISLNGDFFLNTGVKSSILFFINNGKTKEVEFCDIIMENNNIIENSIIKVSLDDIIKQNYNLFDMNLIKIINKACKI
jgi:type I restriction enzyme M protein